MAAALPFRNHITAAQAWQVGRWLLAAVAGGIIASFFTYMVTASLNSQAVVQQQKLVAIEQFDSTGADMDAKISAFNDALLDSKKSPASLENARREARSAIRLHAARTQGAASVLGDPNVQNYTFGLGKLRQFVDGATNAETAMPAAHTHVQLMKVRLKLSNEARRLVLG